MTYEALQLQKTPIVTFGYIIQVTIILAIIVALIYFVLKYLLPRFLVNTKGSSLQVLERIPLEPQVAIYRIKIKNTEYLVAAGGKGVALLDKHET